MQKYKAVRVRIETMDGDYLDDFTVCHFRSDDAGSFSDGQNTGSVSCNSMLADRIEQYVEVPEAVRQK